LNKFFVLIEGILDIILLVMVRVVRISLFFYININKFIIILINCVL